MNDRDRAPVESPPEGATCNEHRERMAIAICPGCRRYACLACWHHPHRLCHACFAKDPLEHADAIAWEDPSVRGPARFFRTATSALSPTRTAPAFAVGAARSAIGFFLLSFLPLAALSGVVPYTRTIFFGPSFAIERMGSPTTLDTVVDVTIACAIGIAMTAIQLVALGAPFVSLSRGYAARTAHGETSMRVMLYRGFLLPLGGCASYLVQWATPLPGPDGVAAISLPLGFALVLSLVPWILLLASMRDGARVGSGVGPFASLLVALVPFVLLLIVQGWLAAATSPFLPAPPERPAPAAPAEPQEPARPPVPRSPSLLPGGASA